MIPLLLTAALLCGGMENPSLPLRPLSIPTPTNPPTDTAELRLSPDGTIFPVAPGTQITARVHGAFIMPLTDPGRTMIRVELVFPLLSKNGKATLLPVGTKLMGRVHLLRGELRFVDFETLILPDERALGVPEGLFRLGPGSLLDLHEGTPAMLTVWRPLRIEAFGPAR